MQNYIKTHLYESINMTDLSKVFHYSPWYSYRLFIQYLNLTPATYIRKLRISKSALKLRDDKVKIIDVVYEVGYESVDGYQRAFYKEFGSQPCEYAKTSQPIYLFVPYPIKKHHRNDMKKMEVKNVFIQIVEKEARKVIIKRAFQAKYYFE